MIDRTFLAAFTLACLIGGNLAIGAEMLGLNTGAAVARAAATPIRVGQLEPVVIVGKRLAPATKVAQTRAADAAAPRVQ